MTAPRRYGHDTVDHVCVADHCIACCPVATSYSEGYDDARSFYKNLHRMDQHDSYEFPSVLNSVSIIFLGLALLMVVHRLKVLEGHSGDDPTA